MTAYLAIIGSIPTVYLWIVKERKKEEELKNKQQEINQIKTSELNKVYVDAVNQFFDDKTFIAGAYALLALVLVEKESNPEGIVEDNIIHLNVPGIYFIFNQENTNYDKDDFMKVKFNIMEKVK